MACHHEISKCACEITEKSPTGEFSVSDIVRCMEKKGSKYSKSTIRTHVTSRMCANAPDNHGTTYKSFERVGLGRYRLC